MALDFTLVNKVPRPPSRRVLAAAALLVVSACSIFNSAAPATPPAGAYNPSPPANRGGTVVLGAWESPDTLNPLTSGTDSGVRASALAFAPLWGLAPDLRPYPDLASRVPTLENGGVKLGQGKTGGMTGEMTMDVRLVSGLHWSDGSPITSDDVIFTWQAIRDPAAGAQVTQGFDHVTGIDRKSETETLWHFDQPYAGYLQMGPATTLLPAHRLAQLPHSQWAGSGYFRQPDVVSGPFTVAQVVPGSQVAFSANPHYADGRSAPGAYAERAPFTHGPYLDRVVYRLYPSKDALITGLRAGELEAGFGLGPEDASTVAGFAGVRADVHSGLRDESLNPNHDVNTATGKPPPWVGDPAVLDALALAADRDAIVAGPLRGTARPSRGLYPAPLAAWGDPSARPAHDLGAARSILDADGWTTGADGVRAKNGRQLQFSLLGVCPTATVAGVLDALKQMWAEAGARVQTECRDRSLFFAGFNDRGTNASAAFDMTLYSNAWGPDPSAWTPVGSSAQVPTSDNPGGMNWNRCRDATLDSDLARVSTVFGAPRKEAARSAERAWLGYHCTIPLFAWPEVRALAKRLHEFAANPGMPAETWNAADWWLAV
jgi:peptide/nickel transport system substrate-binding protein